MKRVVAMLVLALVGVLIGAHADAAKQTPITTLGTPAAVGAKVAAYESWPDAVTADNGWVVLVDSAGDGHVPDVDRKTVVRVSKDKGLTWTITKTFYVPGAGLSGQEGIYRMVEGGRIILLLSNLAGHDDFNSVQAWASDDDGLTWSTLSGVIGWTDPWSFGFMTSVDCDGGKIVIPWNNDHEWGVASTYDGGQTWSRTYATASHQLFEGQITQVGGDRLLMVGRDRSAGLTLFRSADCGATWTSERLGIGGDDGWITQAAVRHGGQWRMITINRNTYQMQVRDVAVEDLWVDAAAWSAPKVLRTLQPAGLVDLGYPVILSVSKSYDLVAWYGPTSKPRQPTIYTARLPWPS